MPVQRLICFALAMLTSACAVRAPRYELREPPLPFEDHGACPFECCTYRDWTVETMTELHAARSLQAPVVFSVKPGEKVVGLNGVVVTRKPGRAVVVDHIELEGSPRAPSVTLKPGDLVH